MKIGAFLYVRNKEEYDNLESELQWFQKTGLECCQLNVQYRDVLNAAGARYISKMCSDYGIGIVGMATPMDGPKIYNLSGGPATNGMVPDAYRAMRLECMKRASDFIAEAGGNTLFAHLGFVPVNCYDREYVGLIQAMQHVCDILKTKNQRYLFETGQESPVVLMRTLEDIGADNIGVNLDPANTTMYGLGNAMDLMEMLSDKIKGFHAKDGCRPTSGRELGKETFLGEGHANVFPILKKLIEEKGFTGDIIIEREVPNAQRHIDVEKEYKMLVEFLNSCNIPNP